MVDLKLELLFHTINDVVQCTPINIDLDVNKIVDTNAIQIVSRIKDLLHDEDYTDSDIVERIVYIFDEYHIDSGNRYA